MFTSTQSSKGGRLIAYFYSGWAFFIPYLLTYLLYLWLKWPANGFAPAALGNGGYIPALLHVYWVLHALHLILAAFALNSWWRQSAELATDDLPSTVNSSPSSVPRPPSTVHCKHSTLDRLWPILPWILLGLIFSIPGVYLEWPSDPWEHLRRITEWSIHPIVGEHSAGYKSFYFFAYSFISVPPNLSRLGNVNIYGTCIDLLLAWQYYRLARAVGLNQKWSFFFVLCNALTFGNVCFSFYKYYTLATTMYAQLGAVALMRITIDFVQNTKNDSGAALNWHRLSRPLVGYVLCLILLSAFVAYNHVQGIGIAGLGIGSIIVWGLVDWKRSAGWWLLTAAVILSVATILWWPRHPAIDAVYRPGGWLNPWYGFNFFAWPSPSAEFMVRILGVFGVLNLMAGLILVCQNHAVGWLTVGPLLLLSLPCLALPLANSLSLASDGGNYIVTYNRMFFAIPAGLGFVAALRKFSTLLSSAKMAFQIRRRFSFNSIACILVLLGLATLLTIPANGRFLNRSWQLLSRTPDDLNLRTTWEALGNLPSNNADNPQLIAATTANIFLLNVYDHKRPLLVKSWVVRHYENLNRSPIDDFELVRSATLNRPYPAIFTLSPHAFVTASSQAALCSSHWSPQVAVLSTSGDAEWSSLSLRLGLRPQSLANGATLWIP